MEKTDIKSLNYEELQEFIKETGEKAFRAKQIYQWMHEKLAEGFDEMTNLSGVLREKLKQTCIYTCLEPVEDVYKRQALPVPRERPRLLIW